MGDPSVSVIIPLWNGAAWIEACLESLLASTRAYPGAARVLVVDNASEDGSPDLVARRFPGVELQRNRRNLGFAAGCNVGLRGAREDVLVLLNQDTEVAQGWLTALVAGLSDPMVGVVGGLALGPDGRIQHGGGRIDWPLGVAHHLDHGEGVSIHLSGRTVDFVTGASMAFRRDLLSRIGLLDEGFWPGYYEDADFCFRAREVGYSVALVPDARLMHRESASFTDPLVAGWARLRGRLRFCLKQMAPSDFVAEFLPAEAVYRDVTLAADRGGYIARAYLEACGMAASLWADRAPRGCLEKAVEGLAGLYGGPYVEHSFAAAGPEPELVPVLTPSPWERLPLVGGPWRRLRRALHRLVIFYVERRESALAATVRAQAERLRALEAEQTRRREP